MEEKTPFSQHVAALSKGMLDAELTEELANLVKAINENGKKGSISLTLHLKPETVQGEVQYIQITPEVKSTLPKPQRVATFMWPTYDGDLLRQDPDQKTLDLREVDTGRGELRDPLDDHTSEGGLEA